MATLKETLYQTMRDDDVVDIGLHVLLGKASPPYGIYFLSPPESPSFPLITFFINAQTGDFPRTIPFMITAWTQNYVAVLDRVYTLFQDKTITASDYGFLLLKYDGSSAEMYDDPFKIWYRQDRFVATGIRT